MLFFPDFFKPLIIMVQETTLNILIKEAEKVSKHKNVFMKFNYIEKDSQYENIISLKRKFVNNHGEEKKQPNEKQSKIAEDSYSISHKSSKEVCLAHWQEFVEIMKEKQNECCYVLYDFMYEINDQFKNKLCLISYIPEGVISKVKFPYSTNSLTLKNHLNAEKLINITDYNDLTYSNVISKI